MSDTVVWMLIENDGAVLLAQRKDDMPPFAGEWALPGELAAEDESASETLKRIAANDFGMELQGEELIETIKVASAGSEYEVAVYRVGFEGQPKFRDSGSYTEVGWATSEELDELDTEVPQALRDFLERLKAGA